MAIVDTNKLLKANGYGRHPDFASIARYAAPLARAGSDADAVLAAVREKFGADERLQMREKPLPYTVFGDMGSDLGYEVTEQFDVVARLPVFVGGAEMPDGHMGYALPIGAVAAYRNAVSPNGVGVDIGCRMTLTLLDIGVEDFLARRLELRATLANETRFGFQGFDKPRRHPVMDDPRWIDRALPLHRHRDLVLRGLGTQGGGNHFADLVVGEVQAEAAWLPLGVGDRFAALLLHSGSRGIGAKMAKHYHALAIEHTQRVAHGIPKDYAWLGTGTDAGREYLSVMQLMGRYAQANHHLVAGHLLRAAGLSALPVSGVPVDVPQLPRFSVVENFHNYAWVRDDGIVIHRKGATPAAAGQPGLIGGSSGSPSFLVEGLGNAKSWESCSHGAGRPYSRTEAKRRHDAEFVEEWMREHGIGYQGLAPDETVLAYKDINRVMAVQEGLLVRTVARLQPIEVLMGGKSDDGD